MNKEQMFEKIKIKIEEMDGMKTGDGIVEDYNIDSITFRSKIAGQEYKPLITLSFAEEVVRQPKEFNCFKCGKKVIELGEACEFYKGILLEDVYAGYGSEHDGDSFTIMICDDCLKINEVIGVSTRGIGEDEEIDCPYCINSKLIGMVDEFTYYPCKKCNNTGKIKKLKEKT